MNGQEKNNFPEVVSVNVSRETGETKKPVEEAELKEDHGIVEDVHSGQPVKQVSLLEGNLIDEFEREHELSLSPGDFAENITTRNLGISKLEPGSKLMIGDRILLEVSQLGKECHEGCAIREETGYCIMPEKGVFCRVLTGGMLKPGDKIELRDEAQA